MIFFISSLPCEAFKHVQQIFRCFRDGGLKGQKVPRSKSGIGRTALELKAANFKCLRGIPMKTVIGLVGEVSDGKVSLKEMTADCQSIKGLQKVQTAFLKCTNMATWEEARAKFPKYACSEMLEPFLRMKFGSNGGVPAEFMSFCQRAIRSSNPLELSHGNTSTDLFVYEHQKSVAVFMAKNVIDLTAAAMSAVCTSVPHFKGFRLAILHLSKVKI